MSKAPGTSGTMPIEGAACGIKPGAPVLVFGSTRPGDEALASACWATLSEEFPDEELRVHPVFAS